MGLFNHIIKWSNFTLIFSTLFIIGYNSNMSATEIAFSFDDAPRDDTFLKGRERTEKLISRLKEAHIDEAIFFCNTRDWSGEKKERVSAYNNAGHIIANHTNDHLNLESKEVTAESFVKSIEKAHEHLKDFSHFQPYFRFPYLRQGGEEGESGADPVKRNFVAQKLKELGYKHGYVTVETYDWHLDSVFQKWMANLKTEKRLPTPREWERLRSIYLIIMRENIEFYRHLAQDLALFASGDMTGVTFNSIPQIVLLHENDLHALFFPDLVKWLREHGYTTLSASSAYNNHNEKNRFWASPEADLWPHSQRRIRAYAKHLGYPGVTVSSWENEETIEFYFNDNI